MYFSFLADVVVNAGKFVPSVSITAGETKRELDCFKCDFFFNVMKPLY